MYIRLIGLYHIYKHKYYFVSKISKYIFSLLIYININYY